MARHQSGHTRRSELRVSVPQVWLPRPADPSSSKTQWDQYRDCQVVLEIEGTAVRVEITEKAGNRSLMRTTIETSGSKDARAPSILHKDTKMMVKHYQGPERSSLKQFQIQLQDPSELVRLLAVLKPYFRIMEQGSNQSQSQTRVRRPLESQNTQESGNQGTESQAIYSQSPTKRQRVTPPTSQHEPGSGALVQQPVASTSKSAADKDEDIKRRLLQGFNKTYAHPLDTTPSDKDTQESEGAAQTQEPGPNTESVPEPSKSVTGNTVAPIVASNTTRKRSSPWSEPSHSEVDFLYPPLDSVAVEWANDNPLISLSAPVSPIIPPATTLVPQNTAASDLMGLDPPYSLPDEVDEHETLVLDKMFPPIPTNSQKNTDPVPFSTQIHNWMTNTGETIREIDPSVSGSLGTSSTTYRQASQDTQQPTHPTNSAYYMDPIQLRQTIDQVLNERGYQAILGYVSHMMSTAQPHPGSNAHISPLQFSQVFTPSVDWQIWQAHHQAHMATPQVHPSQVHPLPYPVPAPSTYQDPQSNAQTPFQYPAFDAAQLNASRWPSQVSGQVQHLEAQVADDDEEFEAEMRSPSTW